MVLSDEAQLWSCQQNSGGCGSEYGPAHSTLPTFGSIEHAFLSIAARHLLLCKTGVTGVITRASYVSLA